MAVDEAHQPHLALLAQEAVPVCVHAQLKGRMLKQVLGPLDSVDTSDLGDVHLARHLEELLVIPFRMEVSIVVADGVVVHDEEPVQEAQTRAVVLAEAGQINAGFLGVIGQMPVFVQPELAALERAQLVQFTVVGAIELTLNPGVHPLVERGRTSVVVDPGVVGRGSIHDSHIVGPVFFGSALEQVRTDTDRVPLGVAAETMKLELNPPGCHGIEDDGGNGDFATGLRVDAAPAQLARVPSRRCHLLDVGADAPGRDVGAEAGIFSAHLRVLCVRGIGPVGGYVAPSCLRFPTIALGVVGGIVIGVGEGVGAVEADFRQ